MNVVCFHNPQEENGYLSNWYLSDFRSGEFTYSSMEQYMMHRKALCFGDQDIADEIMQTTDVARIKEYGRQVKGYDNHHWNGVRQIIVYEGLCAKFSQNEDLKKMLIATKPALLAECAVNDLIWGIGLSMHDESRFDRRKWRGENLLGYALMSVRENIE